MKKKLLLSTSLAMLLGTSIAFAAPQTDYTSGNVSAHIDVMRTDVKASDGGIGKTFGKKTNMGWGATVGLGDRWALNYEGFVSNSKSKFIGSTGRNGDARLQHHELNLLYKLTDDWEDNYSVSAFVGWTRDRGKVDNGLGSYAETGNNWQIGAVGVLDLSDRFKAYGLIGLGNKVMNWKLGLAYEIDENWEVDVFYRHYKVEKVGAGLLGTNTDMSSKGFGLGVTFKFD